MEDGTLPSSSKSKKGKGKVRTNNFSFLSLVNIFPQASAVVKIEPGKIVIPPLAKCIRTGSEYPISKDELPVMDLRKETEGSFPFVSLLPSTEEPTAIHEAHTSEFLAHIVETGQHFPFMKLKDLPNHQLQAVLNYHSDEYAHNAHLIHVFMHCTEALKSFASQACTLLTARMKIEEGPSGSGSNASDIKAVIVDVKAEEEIK
jgi:hypothetical protein